MRSKCAALILIPLLMGLGPSTQPSSPQLPPQNSIDKSQPDAPIPVGKPTDPAWGSYPKNQAPYRWQDFHAKYLARSKQGGIDVVFLGDSLIEFWAREGKEIWETRYAGIKAVNYGRGGDSTRQILWRIEQGELDRISPRLLILMVGTNNLYTDRNSGSDQEIIAGISACAARIREKLPNTPILLLSVVPRIGPFDARISRINAGISKLGGTDRVFFLDLTPGFLDGQGKRRESLYRDGTHLSAAGYQVWDGMMWPVIEQWVKTPSTK